MLYRLVVLTLVTFKNVLLDEHGHMWPSVVALHKLKCSMLFKMSDSGRIPEEWEGNLQRSRAGNVAQWSLHSMTLPRGDTVGWVRQFLQPKPGVATSGSGVQGSGSDDELHISRG